MKRLLTYLFLVIGVGLIFSGSTFAKEKVYFCVKPGDYWKGASRISTVPCSKVMVSSSKAKWKKISAKKYITNIIEAFGPEDAIIQSLYDDFEKHNLDTNIITKIIEKEEKKKKSVIAKEKAKREKDRKEERWHAYKGETAGVIAMCLDKKKLNKVRLSYFNDLDTYRKYESFKKGECNYVTTKLSNPLLFEYVWKNALAKEKYEIKKEDIEKYIGWTQEVFYVSPKGEMVEVVALVYFGVPSQTQEVAEKSDKKEKKWTGKPFSKKKLVSFILNNVITIDYEGKEESYIFKKVKTGCQYESGCWKYVYEVQEGPKMVGKGTWVFDKMAESSRQKKNKHGHKYEPDLSKFANINKKLSKNSIKML